jgi:hypothetical protein
MYMETLRGIAGIGVFPALSLLLFVAVFGTVLVRVARMDRASVQALADLPLQSRDAAATAGEADR